MEQSCYVVTLKYSPVMWNHGRALGETIRAEGFPVRYLLDESYAWMLGSRLDDVTLVGLGGSANPIASALALLTGGGAARLRETFRLRPPGTLVFINLNPFVDRVVIRTARSVNPQVRVVTLLHEPHTTEKSVYGWKRAQLLRVFERLSRGMARASDAVIVPSENARAAFELFYRDFKGSARVIPLAFVDERCPEPLERRYVSFVGHIANAYQKGLDLFTEMVEASVQRSGNYQFQLVTGAAPSPVVASLSARARERLKVVHAPQLSDQAISRAIRESVAVLLLPRRVMQSGVLPMAMMNGTPVIASNLPGLTQFVEHAKTGWVVPVEPSLDQRFAAVDAIRADFDAMSIRCRDLYESVFDSRCVRPHVRWILGLETPRDAALRGPEALG